MGHLKHDWDALVPVGRLTHYLGDAVALVAAETRAIAEQAKALIRVEYEVLPGVFSPQQALAEGAPLVHESGTSNVLAHEHLVRGDAEEAIEHSKYVVTQDILHPLYRARLSGAGVRRGLVDPDKGERSDLFLRPGHV